MPAVHAAAETLRLSVAPMIDWTDTFCRAFHRVVAPHARVYTEMLHANAVLHGDRERLLGFDASQHPVALQLGGSDPALLAQAARIGEAHGYDEINLNCGCPSDRVQAGKFGACLMREPDLVADCVAAMIGAVQIPVTMKCRLGVDDDHAYEKFRAFVDVVAATGCTRFVVHARNAWLQGLSPKENREIPPLRHGWAYRLKAERPQLDIVLNGGIASIEAVREHLAKLDGVMLGRAAYHTPYLLHELDVALFGGRLRTREQLLRAYLPYVERKLGEGVALKNISKHVLGLYHGQPGGRLFRQILSEGAHKPNAGIELVERAIAATKDALASAA
ncbi:MAG: tRNA dihydrouridine(20/20a) synthase DusA [Pantoea sp.]|uniref:tRNA dihydrouridine(20/20a) synthase DusA n=1 Tax=Pantoea sp. TaxID=69393 RepID=UPI0039E681FA